MAEIKWIKIATDIFDNRKIKMIESMPEGDTIIVIWFKILTLAGSVNDTGYVYFTKDIPYTEQMLATAFNRSLATIQLAMRTFEQFGMIEITEDIFHVTNWEKYQNVDGMEKIREQTRKRVADFRERKKIECNVTGNVTVTECNGTDIDIDKDIEKDKEKDKEKKKKEKPTLHKYGEYKHVLLSDDQYNRLVMEYGVENVAEYIRKVDEYCQQNGKRYSDYNLTIRKWFGKDNKKPVAKKTLEQPKAEDHELTDEEWIAAMEAQYGKQE